MSKDIRNNKLDVEIHDKGFVLYNKQPMKIGRFLKKFLDWMQPSIIERMVFEYNTFYSKIKSEKFDNLIIITFQSQFAGRQVNGDLSIRLYPVSRISHKRVPDTKLQKLIGAFHNEINIINGFINIDMLNYLKYKQYDIQTGKWEFTISAFAYDYIYIDNEKDLYDFIEDRKSVV